MDKKEEAYFDKTIKELCKEKQIQLESYSYDWILKLKKEEKVRHIIQYTMELNSSIAYKLAKDKYATYEMLKANDIPIITYHMIFNSKTRKEYVTKHYIEEIKEYYEKYNKRLVVKSNHGAVGMGVYYCDTIRKAKKAAKELFKNNDNISICPFYDYIVEYRAVYIDGEIFVVFGKLKPYVIGDGKHTVKELLKIQQVQLPDNVATKKAKEEIDFKYIPKEGQKHVFFWKHNLSSGGVAFVLEDEELKKRIEELAIKAAKTINIRAATIDIIHEKEDTLKVLEINSNVCINKFAQTVEGADKITRQVYGTLLDKMFE